MANQDALGNSADSLFGDYAQALIEGKMQLYLFGMGSFTQNEVLPLLRRLEIKVSGIIDNDGSKWGTTLNGTVTEGIASILDRRKDVLVAVSVVQHVQEICTQLASHGFEKVVVLPVSAIKQAGVEETHELPYPIQVFTCSACSTNCSSCCFRRWRRQKPSFQLTMEDIAFLGKGLSEHESGASLQLVGGDPLLWTNLEGAVRLLSGNDYVRRLELYTAGTAHQCRILAPVVDLLDCIYVSLYKSNARYAEELQSNFGKKVVVHEIPEHIAMTETTYPLQYPVECDCRNLSYHTRDIWICPWAPLDLQFREPAVAGSYRVKLSDALAEGIPSQWVHGADEKLCELCPANIDRRKYAGRTATP